MLPTTLCKNLKLVLPEAAESGIREWKRLKIHLTTGGMDEKVLERYKEEVFDIFCACVAECAHRSPPSSYGPSSSAAPLRVLRASSPATSDYLPQSRPKGRERWSRAATPEEMLEVMQPEVQEIVLWLTEAGDERSAVSFGYGTDKKSFIGAHIIERFEKQLGCRVQDGRIKLVCRPERGDPKTYVVNFIVEDGLKADVLLGTKWKEDTSSKDVKGKKPKRKNAADVDLRSSTSTSMRPENPKHHHHHQASRSSNSSSTLSLRPEDILKIATVLEISRTGTPQDSTTSISAKRRGKGPAPNPEARSEARSRQARQGREDDRSSSLHTESYISSTEATRRTSAGTETDLSVVESHNSEQVWDADDSSGESPTSSPDLDPAGSKVDLSGSASSEYFDCKAD